MNFLVDAQLSPRFCLWLHQKGHQARHVIDLPNGLTLPDTELWEIAKLSQEIIISKDWDFYERALLLPPPPKVLHLSLGNCSNFQLFSLLEKVWGTIESLLNEEAKLISVSATHINVFN